MLSQFSILQRHPLIHRLLGEFLSGLAPRDARAAAADPKVASILNVPNADIYAIEVSFQALKDKAERDYLNQLPTSFALSDEAVDRLRVAAATIILESRPAADPEGRWCSHC